MQLKPGTLLQNGEYKIIKVLGQGGFGITYLAEQTSLRRKVAIKEFFMKEYCNRDGDTSQVSVPSVGSKELVDKFREKFVKEAQNIASFSHNNIIKIHDVFEENNTAYYVMEYLDCGSLSDYLSQRGRLTEEEALAFIRQIADALSYIHEHNVNHLDVKPGNILLDKKQNAILIDFGLSKHYDEKGGQTSSTPVGISHGYAPLEQYKQGGVSTFSPATDIYSLGATLYKLLTGTTPPEADEIYENGISFPKDIHLSESIRKAIMFAMQPKRKDRPQSIAEFLKTLDVKAEDEWTDIEISVETVKKPTVFKDEIFNVNGVEFKMIAVEGGTFQMGGTYEQGNSVRRDEKPVHNVTLSDYYIGETVVTQELWETIMRRNPSRFKGSMRPVTNVSWHDCQEFINRLNRITGKNFRLPTEAEWEYAARGGNKSQGYIHSGGNKIGDVAWYCWNSMRPHDVKTKQANELGIYDMSGNVWEWCQDWKGSYSSSSQTNPTGPSSGSRRVLRGGDWSYGAWYCRVSYRNGNYPGRRFNVNGLRLAL